MKTMAVVMLCFLLLQATAPSIAPAQTVDDLTIMTESYPPLNFSRNGQLQGVSVDLMDDLLKKVNSKLSRRDIELVPWARGYLNLRTQKNTCLFSMTRTRERENLFKWVGPICTSRIVLIAPKASRISVKSVDDLKKFRIGVVRDDVGELLLVEKGIKREELSIVASPERNADKLKAGRIDLWACGDMVARWIMKEKGLNPQDYETVFVLTDSEQFYAFHIDTSDQVIRKFQSALNELKQQGRIKRLLERY